MQLGYSPHNVQVQFSFLLDLGISGDSRLQTPLVAVHSVEPNRRTVELISSSAYGAFPYYM